MKSPQQTRSDSGREAWIDSAKGIAIILVVFCHVLGGLLTQGLMQPVAGWQDCYSWVYLFHMPVFFFLSGWLVRGRRPRPQSESLAQYAGTLLYPYMVWGLLTWLAHLAGDAIGATNSPANVWAPVLLLYSPSAGPWFLYVLFMIHVLWLIVEKNRAWSLCLLGLALLANYLFPLSNLGKFAIYYGLGFEVAGLLAGRNQKMPHLAWLLMGLGCFGLMTVIFATDPSSHVMQVLFPACLGSAGTVMVALSAAGVRWTAFLEWAGRNSLAIYVTHSFAPPFVRWVLVNRFHMQTGEWLLAAGVSSALLSCALVIWMERKYSLQWLFRWPKLRNKAV